MKPTPVARYPEPVYPTRAQALADPAWLLSNVPMSWRASVEMAGAVAFFVALSGCGPAAPPSTPTAGPQPAPIGVVQPQPDQPQAGAPSPNAQPPGEAADVKSTVSAEPGAQPSPAPAPPAGPPRQPPGMIVAPVFAHGEGRGATGCVVVAPPVFLSEEEAMVIIREELNRNGISLAQRDVPSAISVPPPAPTIASGHNPSAQPIKIDGVDPVRHVAVEYVSAVDSEAWTGQSMSSVQGYDTKAAAEAIAKAARSSARQPLYFGVLYDPITTIDFRNAPSGPQDWKTEEKAARKQAASLLRDQVRDLLSWLRSQNAI